MKLPMKALTTVLFAAVILSGCSSTSSSPAQPSARPSPLGPINSLDVTVENLMRIPLGTEGDCAFMENKYGGMTILHCMKTENMFFVPTVGARKAMTAIGRYAFEGNDSPAKAIRLPETIKHIELDAFHENQNLEILVADPGLETIGNSAFQGAKKLRIAQFGDGLVAVGQEAFAQVPTLREVTLPDTVKTIDSSAFDGASTDLVIRGKAGSVAERYAKTHNISFDVIG